MKTSRWILMIWLAASAWAQTARPQSPAPGATKPAAAVVKPAAGAAAKAPAAMPAAATTPKPAARLSAKRSAPRQAGGNQLVAAKITIGRGRKGQRDPFVSPIAERPTSGPACTGTGKRCLYISDLSLLGIVQSQDGVIAVVASGARTYFLREHDPLADGDVEKITRDAITLRQRSSDVLGRPLVRQVVRKLSPAA